MAAHLGLYAPEMSWDSDRTRIAIYVAWLSQVTGAIGKIGKDVVLMSQQGVDAIGVENGGSSSAMPHKQKPVLGELYMCTALFKASANAQV